LVFLRVDNYFIWNFENWNVPEGMIIKELY
jgi:hypothetical protein